MRSLEAKIVVLGSQGVGKTSVVVRYVGRMFNKHVSPTIGASFFTCKMMIDCYRVKLQLWDTAGQERFRSMAPMYYRKANAALLVFDISNGESFDDVKQWVQELMKNVDGRLVMCLVGNKCDLREEREVSQDQALEYAASIGAFYQETSALSNEGVEETFCQVAQKLIEMYETVSDSGLHVVDSMSGTSVSRKRSEDSLVIHAHQDFNTAAQPEQEGRGSCCYWAS